VPFGDERIVCGVCGALAAEQVTIEFAGRSLVKDLCAQHVRELTEGARPGHSGFLRLADPAAWPTGRRRR
jgi:hypothetical protein